MLGGWSILALLSPTRIVFSLSLPLISSLKPPSAFPSPANVAFTTSNENASFSAPASSSNLNFSGQSPFEGADNALPNCNDMLGTNLNLGSCYSAVNQIGSSPRSLRFGIKGLNPDIQVPRRYSSRDGTCVIDAFFKDGAASDISNLQHLSLAAGAVVNQCVQRGAHYSGGYIRDLGNFGNLAIVVSLYQPSANCYGSIGGRKTVSQQLIDQIPTTFTKQMFGRTTAPAVESILPQLFAEWPLADIHPRGSGFYVRVDISNQDISVMTRWFEIWAAAVSINALCVAQGKAGKVTFPSGLEVKLDRLYGPAGGIGPISANVTDLLENA